MQLYSKSYFFQRLFFLLGCLFIFYWILVFVLCFIIGDDFSWKNLIVAPVLIIPFWIFYIFQIKLERLKLTDDGITVYKLLFLKFRHNVWSDFDYSFYTISRGRGGSVRVMYLVKGQVLVVRVDDSNYKNYDDLSEFVSSKVENKGLIQLNSFDEFRFLFKRKIKKLP